MSRSAAVLACALALCAAPARAVPLVYDGAPEAEARAEAAKGAGLPLDQLEPVALDALLQRPAGATGAATLRHCAGPPTAGAAVRAHLQRADVALRGGDAVAAADHLDLGLTALGCLGERVEPPVAARLFLLRGAVAAARGAPEVAQAELRTALSFAPALAWDPALPGDGALLEAERAAHFACAAPPACPSGAPLRIAPAARSAGPWLDGRALPAGEAAAPAPPGLHLLQVASTAGLRSAWLTLSGPATVALPGAYRRPITPGPAGSSPTDQAQIDDLRALLGATMPGAGAAYLWAGGGLWLVGLDPAAPAADALTTLRAPPPPAPVDEKKRR
jgi:hypothetical protein